MTKRLFEAPDISPAMIDAYMRRARRERSRALAEMIRGIFTSPVAHRAEVHELPARTRPARTREEPDAPDCTDRAA